MNAIWPVDVWIFVILLLWSFAWPRNEWMGNTFSVLLGMILVLWYQPAMPALLGGGDVPGGIPLNFPFHRLIGFLVLISIFWMALQAWEDFKQERIERAALPINPPTPASTVQPETGRTD